MSRSLAFLLFAASSLFLPHSASAQGGFGRGGGMGRPYEPNAPKMPVVELAGPLDSALARVMLNLDAQQAAHYAQVYDSFMVATRPERDSAGVALTKMNERLDQGDRAAALFYAERVQDIGKLLKNRQDRFENNLRRWLNGDQIKAYKQWKDGEEQAAEHKRREDALRWREAGFGGFGGGGMSRPVTPEPKTVVASPHSVPNPAIGSQIVRAGRVLYIAGQLGIDSSGTIVAPALRAQAERAFGNLGTILQAAGASARDVVSLTVYVVNYRADDLATIRDAGASYLGSNAPVVTVLGVQSLGREGALISIGATALAPASAR